MGSEQFGGSRKMNKLGFLTETQKKERDRKEEKLYEMEKKLLTPSLEDEEFERRKERGEVTEKGEELLPETDD
jgi:hypothetical protein